MQGVSREEARTIIAKYVTTRPVEGTPVQKPQVDRGHTPIEAYPSTYIQ